MDDKAAIDFHAFGGVTFQFDDGPINLRRCRLGDLEHAKNLLAELRSEIQEELSANEGIVTELLPLIVVSLENPTDEQARAIRKEQIKQFNDANDRVADLSRPLVYRWLVSVIERMGDGQPPKDMQDWPLDLLDGLIPGRVIQHWQTRPLVSGRISQNRTTDAPNNSGPSLPEVSYPLVQPSQ